MTDSKGPKEITDSNPGACMHAYCDFESIAVTNDSLQHKPL